MGAIPLMDPESPGPLPDDELMHAFEDGSLDSPDARRVFLLPVME